MMQTKIIVLAPIAAAVLLAATATAPAEATVHWTSLASPGLQHYYRNAGSPFAACSKRSARVIRCVHVQVEQLDRHIESCHLSWRLLSRNVAQRNTCDEFGRRDLVKLWLPAQKWLGDTSGWVA